jgi:S-adenosylmethionine:diacylglycerol 3-amino-3-carboxypropyl transferase
VPVVDHFIPWALHPLDLGHNFVLAHAECNSQKRDLLAAEKHLAAWDERNRQHDEELSMGFDRKGVLYNLASTIHIAKWAYSRTATTGGRVWKQTNQMVELTGIWASILV